MAIQIGHPGVRGGPCRLPCIHEECAELRRLARAACYSCGRPAGHRVPLFIIGDGVPIHGECVRAAVAMSK